MTDRQGSWEKLLDAAGGTVVDLTKHVHPTGAEVLFAATLVGVFHSTDGGDHWALLGETSVPPMVQALAVSTGELGTAQLFAGTSVGLFYTDIDQPDWKPLLTGIAVLALGIAPSDALAHPLLIATEELDLLRSEDGGREWHDANAGLDWSETVAIRHSPDYAGDRTIFLATIDGIYRSRNGGEAWRRLDAPFAAVHGLEFLTGASGAPVLVAATAMDGVWTSPDSGKTWARAMETDWLDQMIVTGPSAFAICADHSLISCDLQSGTTTGIDGDLPEQMNCLLATGNGWMIGNEEEGIARLIPGDGWQPASNGLAALVRGNLVFADDGDPALALIESGFAIRLSWDGRTNWQLLPGLDFDELVGIELFRSAPDALTVQAIGWDGIYEWRDGKAGWEPVIEPPDDAEIVGSYRFRDGELLAVLTNGRVMRSSGEHAGHLGVAGDISVASIVPGRGDSTALWVLAMSLAESDRAEVSIWYTVNRGKTWERWLSAEPQAVMAIDSAADAEGRDLLIVGALHQLSLVRLIDGELETRQIDLGEDAAIVALAASPAFATDATIHVATNLGLFQIDARSGVTTPDRSGGPRTILDLVAREDDASTLYAIERGGAVWRRNFDLIV